MIVYDYTVYEGSRDEGFQICYQVIRDSREIGLKI